jgi:hypothetical protein
LKEISIRRYRLGLALMVALHLGILALFTFDILPGAHQPGTFLFHHGGDQDSYYVLARSLLDGHPIQSKYPLGFPLLLIPWIALFQPTGSTALIPPVALFHSLVLFPLSQFVLASLALRITHHRTAALLSVLVWTILPLPIWFVLALTGRAELGAIWAVHLPWPQMLSDPPAAFLTLVSFRLLFVVLDAPDQHRILRWSVPLGVVCGLLLLIRFNALLSVAALALVLAVARRWQALTAVGAICLIFVLPQLGYNVAYFGSPLITGYQVLDRQPPDGLFSLSYPLKVFSGKDAIPAWGGLAALLAVFSGGLYVLWQRDQYGALALGGWAALYLVFFSLYYYSWTGGLTRFLLPVYPALAMLAASLPFLRPIGARKSVQLQTRSTTDA